MSCKFSWLNRINYFASVYRFVLLVISVLIIRLIYCYLANVYFYTGYSVLLRRVFVMQMCVKFQKTFDFYHINYRYLFLFLLCYFFKSLVVKVPGG